MTPGCSVCGFAVEWLRSCYSSQWRLFQNDPEILTPGRFVFCPENTPHFPGVHHYGSNNWLDFEERDETIGEDPAASRKWSAGVGPRIFPLAKRIGGLDCFASGEPSPIASNYPPCGNHALLLDLRQGDLDPNPDNPPLMLGVDALHARSTGIEDGQFYSVKLTWPLGSIDPNSVTCEVTSQGVVATATPFSAVTCADITTFVFPFPASGFPINLQVDILPSTGPLPLMPNNDGSFYEGFPFECYSTAGKRQTKPANPDPFDQSDTLALAQVLEALGTNAAAAAALLAAYLNDPSAQLFYVDNSLSVVPGSVIAVTDSLSIVCVTGTSNPQQAACQVLYEAAPAVDYGPYSTNGIWHFASTAIHNRMSLTPIDASKPILYCGHSYGGAICCILAGESSAWQPARDVRLLTFGCPKPGDHRLRTMLQGTRHRHLVNRGDPVPGVPFSPEEYEPLLLIVPILRLGQWTTFVRPRRQFIIEESGVQTETEESPLALLDLINMVTLALAGDPLPLFSAHFMSTYVARVALNPFPV